MALTLLQLEKLRDELEQTRLSGVREIKDQNGETISYKSDSEIAAALNFVTRKISELRQGQPKTIVFSTHKGIS
jgi:hypothetical protein